MMQAIFIRHGSAEPVGPDGDAARKLTDEGRTQARATAKGLAAMGVNLEVILASPLARAVESADIVAEVHGCQVERVQCLAPPVDAAGIAARLTELAAGGAAAVGLVGHTPSLEEVIAGLVCTDRRLNISLSKAGAAMVTVAADDSPERPELVWLIRREQLAELARSGGVK